MFAPPLPSTHVLFMGTWLVYTCPSYQGYTSLSWDIENLYFSVNSLNIPINCKLRSGFEEKSPREVPFWKHKLFTVHISPWSSLKINFIWFMKVIRKWPNLVKYPEVKAKLLELRLQLTKNLKYNFEEFSGFIKSLSEVSVTGLYGPCKFWGLGYTYL